ncbi:MAG: PQQ-binding-like beta-propeller repeat protein [Pseudomonadota bacterium]
MALVTAAASGCALFDYFDREPPLEGERISLRSNQASRTTVQVREVALPPVQRLENWTQTNGTGTHNSGHLDGPTGLSLAWTRDIGAGGSSDGQITSAPVIADGTVFTLDAASQVTALDASSGAERWQVSVAPEAEEGDEGFGGGIAYEAGRLLIATGFGEILALEAATGAVLWRKSFGAPFRAAPAVDRGTVVAVTRDNRAFGVTASNGQIRWRVSGASAEAGLLGGASPAMSGGLVAVPFTSGELIALSASSGRQFWSALLSGGRRGLARSSISDVTGDPIVIGNFIVAANQSGRIVAVEARGGRRVWTRNFGSQGAIWGAADTLFVVSDDASLMRISARDGQTLWQTPLPAFEDQEDREDPITYSGPVLVSGRVLVASSEEQLLVFDALTGAQIAEAELSAGARNGVVVAADTVFVLADDGRLHAFR